MINAAEHIAETVVQQESRFVIDLMAMKRGTEGNKPLMVGGQLYIDEYDLQMEVNCSWIASQDCGKYL